MSRPQPITDLVATLTRLNLPRNEESVRKVAVMLSMTESEIQLALRTVLLLTEG